MYGDVDATTPIECAPAPTAKKPWLNAGFANARSGSEMFVPGHPSTGTVEVVPSTVTPSETVNRSPPQKASVTVTTAAPELANVKGLPVAVDPCHGELEELPRTSGERGSGCRTCQRSGDCDGDDENERPRKDFLAHMYSPDVPQSEWTHVPIP